MIIMARHAHQQKKNGLENKQRVGSPHLSQERNDVTLGVGDIASTRGKTGMRDKPWQLTLPPSGTPCYRIPLSSSIRGTAGGCKPRHKLLSFFVASFLSFCLRKKPVHCHRVGPLEHFRAVTPYQVGDLAGPAGGSCTQVFCLACILGLSGPDKQDSLTSKECSVSGRHHGKSNHSRKCLLYHSTALVSSIQTR